MFFLQKIYLLILIFHIYRGTVLPLSQPCCNLQRAEHVLVLWACSSQETCRERLLPQSNERSQRSSWLTNRASGCLRGRKIQLGLWSGKISSMMLSIGTVGWTADKVSLSVCKTKLFKIWFHHVFFSFFSLVWTSFEQQHDVVHTRVC